MDQTDVTQLAQEVTRFCQRQVTNIALSPIKQAILIAVIATISGPEGMPAHPEKWLLPG